MLFRFDVLRRVCARACLAGVLSAVVAGCDQPVSVPGDGLSGTWVTASASLLSARWRITLAEQLDGSFEGIAVEVRRTEGETVFDVRGTHECPGVSVLITDSLGTRYRMEGRHVTRDSLVLDGPWGTVRLGKLGPGGAPSTF